MLSYLKGWTSAHKTNKIVGLFIVEFIGAIFVWCVLYSQHYFFPYLNKLMYSSNFSLSDSVIDLELQHHGF